MIISNVNCDLNKIKLKILPWNIPSESLLSLTAHMNNEWNRKDLVVGYISRKPFFYYDQSRNEFRGIEWEITKLFATRNNLTINAVECFDFLSCEK